MLMVSGIQKFAFGRPLFHEEQPWQRRGVLLWEHRRSGVRCGRVHLVDDSLAGANRDLYVETVWLSNSNCKPRV